MINKNLLNHLFLQNKLKSKGHIYKGTYEGWYCISDEAFLTDDEIIVSTNEKGEERKVSMTSGNPVIWMKEENYMFRLTEFKSQLTKWVDSKGNN